MVQMAGGNNRGGQGQLDELDPEEMLKKLRRQVENKLRTDRSAIVLAARVLNIPVNQALHRLIWGTAQP